MAEPTLLIKCKVWEACHLVATAVLSSVTCVIGPLQSFQTPPPLSGVWLVGGPVGSRWTRSCLRGLPGRQATLLPAEQNASCTDKPPFSVCLSHFVFVSACSQQSRLSVCLSVCVCVRVLNTCICSHSEQHHTYAEVMTTKQNDGSLTYQHS